MEQPETFERELEHLINKHGRERGSNTPDYILAEYLASCLASFNKAVQLREQWYGRGEQFVATGLATIEEAARINALASPPSSRETP